MSTAENHPLQDDSFGRPTGAPSPLLPEEFGLPDYLHNFRKISQGGMGAVYQATHRISEAKLAVKILLPQHLNNTVHVRRFLREATATRPLDHPNLVRVFDCGITEKSVPFIVMEFVDGITLADYIDEHGALSAGEVVEIFLQVAAGLVYAHNHGIVHRDLKPANIMLTYPGETSMLVKVLDFGIAKLTNAEAQGMNLTTTGEVMGTPTYMSPEQCLGDLIDARSDIYSYGCSMYNALTGNPPFTAGNAVSMLAKQAHTPISPPSKIYPELQIAPELEYILLKTLEKSPADRYQTMEQVRCDLQSYRNGETRALRISGQQRRQLRLAARTVLSVIVGFLTALLALWLLRLLPE